MTPIFLFSLPRSGSTLLQRLLAAHPAIHTVSEPWFLLPLLYTLKDEGVRAVYDHRWLRVAVDDFIGELPGGRADYLDALGACARQLYARTAPPGTRYFLDKTPRYHLIVDELAAAFPDAPLLFLWRHPLAVAASIIDSWSRPPGRWNLFRTRVDLHDGLASLVRAYRQHHGRALAVRYEALVREPDRVLERILAWLGLAPAPDATARLGAQGLRGRLGDQHGTARYAHPSHGSLDAWRTTMANPLRRRWCRRYVAWIGAERLATMGYERAALEAEIAAVPGSLRHLGSDLVRLGFGWFDHRLDLEPRLRRLLPAGSSPT
jgi:Sulfotransferase family